MSTTTTNYELIKPELTDAADITATNENWDKIDTELKKKYDPNNKPTASDVGAYSLLRGEAIPANADLNNYITPGSYICQTTANAKTILNSPVTTTGYSLQVEIVSGASSNYLHQTIKVNNETADIYKRRYHPTSGFGAWTQLATADKAMHSNFGYLTATDLFAWADEQTVGGTFVVDPSVTTKNTPVSGRYFTGILEIGGNGRKLTLTSTTIGYADDGNTYTVVKSAGAWRSWYRLATTDYALPLTGGTMTGALAVKPSTATLSMSADGSSASLMAYVDWAKRKFIQIPTDKSASPFNKLQYVDMDADGNGNSARYDILHTGNKDQIFTYGTNDLTAGSSTLETGKLYFVYE